MRIKTIILYCRRNVGLYALSFLVAKGWYDVKVISDDLNVRWLANTLGVKLISFDTMGEFDLFLCVHGNKILGREYLQKGVFVNVHPCLHLYRGADPISKYIANKDVLGSVQSHYMIEEVDAGEVIEGEFFTTPPVANHADFYNIAAPYYFKVIAKTLEKLENK